MAANPTQGALDKAFRVLRPGGWCYTEWSWRIAVSATQVQRRLTRAGFEAVSCHRPWPARAVARAWLPLRVRGASHYFLRDRWERVATASPARRIRAVLLGLAGALAMRSGYFPPICALARRPGDADRVRDPAGMCTTAGGWGSTSGRRGDLLALIRHNWSSWGLGPTPDHVSAVVLTGGRGASNRVVVLVFAEPGGHPRVAVKLARVPESAPALVHEAAMLRALARQRPGGVRGVPRVLFLGEHGGTPLLGQTAMAGVPLSVRLRRNNHHALALAVTDWLVDLAGSPVVQAPGSWWAQQVQTVLAEMYEHLSGLVDAGVLRATESLLAELPPLPLVPEVRDLWSGNVLVAPDGAIAVVDWEGAELQGLGGLDLIYFLADLGLQLDRASVTGRYRASYAATTDPSTRRGEVFHECLARYARGTGAEIASSRSLRVLVWLRRTLWAYRGAANARLEAARRAALKTTPYFEFWLAELAGPECGPERA